MGWVKPRARCASIVNRLGERNTSISASARSSAPVRRQGCGGRRCASAQRTQFGRSHGSRFIRQSTCIGHTSQCSFRV